jgi:hypothetical protein
MVRIHNTHDGVHVRSVNTARTFEFHEKWRISLLSQLVKKGRSSWRKIMNT